VCEAVPLDRAPARSLSEVRTEFGKLKERSQRKTKLAIEISRIDEQAGALQCLAI
jgi:hypothetical protein